MIYEIWKIIREAFRGANQRINILIVIFIMLFFVLLSRLFSLQVVNGQYYFDNYVQKSMKYITVPAARGNIYDKDGKILAYNELVNNITIADVDAYPANNQGINKRNRMLLKLARILRKYDCKIDSKYFIEKDENGNFVYTTKSEKQHKKFIADIYGRVLADLDEGRNYRYPSTISLDFISSSKSLISVISIQ